MDGFCNQIVGLVRFSLVTTGDFYPGFDSVEAMQEFLFDEARLARRFAMFEALCLPALARQSDPDFTVLFLTAETLPTRWRERLDSLLAPHPWARVVAMPPMLHYPAIKAAFQSLPAEGFSHRTSFRLDDDDAVDLGHVARLRRLAERLQVVQAPDRPMALGFNRGFYLRFREGRNEIFDARERTPLSVGAALVAPAGYEDNVYVRNHRALAQYFDCWSDAESFVYLRTLHRDNKSNPHFSGSQRELGQGQVNRILRESFGLRPAELKALA
ncbi:putative rhamnosyl transferase [Frigidibacter sp. ROC022]|uniref:putative rhamnosyl transferase n=1 Tax=Frigidibacter sp. ROC022 TaxID=2971796 RepID=UPI00215A24B0|nr:putative rhamnosyl transferase [Frigidibacter sp. ROC022]MCR8726543.1 putative rhamnosyl transferase [Frigidibacter sp. ROC022]